jgi:hypothetical protein
MLSRRVDYYLGFLSLLWHVIVVGNNFILICNGIDKDLDSTALVSRSYFILCSSVGRPKSKYEIHTMNLLD